MRKRAGVVLIVLFSLAMISVVALGPTQTITVPKTAIQRLEELNVILDEMLQGLSSGSLKFGELAEMLDEAFASFDSVLAEMPVAGLQFAVVFAALYDIRDGLLAADELLGLPWWAVDPYSVYLAIDDARRAKEWLLWSASGGLIQTQLECSNGKALVMVYPGFDCHALQAKVSELLAAGKCVTVGWQEPPCYTPDPNVAFGGPTATQVFGCLGMRYLVGTVFQLDPMVEPDAPGFAERYSFGDPNADCHVSEPPTSPHATYVNSALALDVVGGQPVLPDPNRLFLAGDVLKPWYRVKDVCDPLQVDWRVYGPDGTLAYPDSSILDPVDFNTDCLSSYSSSGWMSLDAGSFGTAGTYVAELWLGEEHCANHTFQMAGPGNRSPYVHNDFCTMNEDSALEAKEPGVFGNDLDPDGDSLTATLVEGARHGMVDLDPDGTFTYVPETDFFGVDSFTYEASDPSGLSAEAEVTILVTPVDDAPVANDDVMDVTVSVDEGTWTLDVPEIGWTKDGTFAEDGVLITIPAPGVLMNDTDPDNDPLTLIFFGPAPPTMKWSPDGSLEIPVDVPDLPKSYQIPYTAADPSGLEATGEIMIRIVRQ